MAIGDDRVKTPDPTTGAVERRLALIEGQVRGIARMVEDQRSCVEVLDQVAAVIGALREVANSIVEEHVRRCLDDVLNTGASSEAQVDEAMRALARLVRTVG